MAVTPLTAQDLVDSVNSLGIDKATFTTFLQGSILLAARNKVLAQIESANATANTASTSAATAIAALNTELAAIDAQYRALVGG